MVVSALVVFPSPISDGSSLLYHRPLVLDDEDSSFGDVVDMAHAG